MRPSYSCRFTLFLAFALSIAATCPRAHAKPRWEPVTPADLAATESATFPGADAEILFSRHVMEGNQSHTWTDHHIQAKIYTARGVEQATLFTIDFDQRYRISSPAARVVKPNGESFELPASAFHEESLLKSRGGEYKKTTFAFPDLRPGDVIEYQWTQGTEDAYFTYYKFFCEGPVATREYLFRIEGSRSDYTMRWFNCAAVEADKKKQQIVIHRLPAFVAEPLMPAETELRAWLMISFDHPFLHRFYQKESQWDLIGPYAAEEFRLDTTPAKAVRAKAGELVAGLTDPAAKLERLYRYCQTEVRNFDWSDDPDLAEVRKKRDNEDENPSPAKTLDRRCGTPGDINRLFAALARAAGFEVRLTMSADRNEILNIKGPEGWTLVDRNSVAVKFGAEWKIFRPGDRPVPSGLLSPRDEGAIMYVCDEKKGWFQLAQTSTADQNLTRRKGRFALDEEGTLTGEVEVSYEGQPAIRARERWWKLSTDDLAQRMREPVADRLAAAEISEVTTEKLTADGDPLVVRYKVRVPGFAEPLGNRFAFTPNFFTANAPQLFTAETRKYPVALDFAERESDDLEVVLPAGYTLDNPSAPAPVHDDGGIIRADYTLRYSPKTRTLSCVRNLAIGANGIVNFRAESYPVLRNLFSRIHQSDTHRLLIKPKVALAPAAPSPNPAAPNP